MKMLGYTPVVYVFYLILYIIYSIEFKTLAKPISRINYGVQGF